MKTLNEPEKAIMETSRHLGKMIKLERIKIDLSVEELAKKLGVYSTTVYSWQKGDYPPKLEYLLKMCDIFSVRILIEPNKIINFIEIKSQGEKDGK